MDVGVATPDIILLANTPSASSLPAAREGRKKHKQDKKNLSSSHWSCCTLQFCFHLKKNKKQNPHSILHMPRLPPPKKIDKHYF